MKSRQRIKVLKIYGVYDRRGKKCNNKPLTYFFKDCKKNLRQETSQWYWSKKFLKKLISGRRMKIKEIIHITD